MEDYLKLDIGKGNIVILRPPQNEEEVNLYFIGKCKEIENYVSVYGNKFIDKSILITQKMLILEHSNLIKDKNVRHHFEKCVNNWFYNFDKKLLKEVI